jgi:hypothetical protein
VPTEVETKYAFISVVILGSDALKMKVVPFSEMFISTYRFTEYHTPEAQHLHLHRENLSSHINVHLHKNPSSHNPRMERRDFLYETSTVFLLYIPPPSHWCYSLDTCN